MKSPSHFSKFAVIAALSLGLGSTAAANIVTNGGFETGNFSGWTLSGNVAQGLLVNGSSAHSGSFGALFAGVGNPPGIISQSLTTVIGDTYTLAFWLANTPLTQGQVSSFAVSWNGSTIAALTQTNASAFGFTQFTTTGLVATSTSTSLSFAGRHDPLWWSLDDISVVSNGPAGNNAPDAGTSAGLLALALAAMAGARRWMR